jgi:peptide/nickel transport system substrate-binding protein
VYPYDADKARELLDEAGYAGEEVEMEGLRGRFMSDKEICEATAGFLEEAGLKVKLNIHEWSEYRKKRDDQRWGPIGVSSLGQSSRVGAHTLNMQATCTHHQWADQTTYCNEEVDKWVNEAISTYDEDKAARALREAQLLLYEDAAFIPLFTLKMVYGRSNKIKWQPAPIERIHAWTMGPA